MKTTCSIGIFAHNEAANIRHLLEAISSQKLERVEIDEVIVVSSASTDATDRIVADYAAAHPGFRLITQA